jgi:hypothetical protein
MFMTVGSSGANEYRLSSGLVRLRRQVLALILFTFAVYLANGRVISDGDSFSTRLLPLSLLAGGGLTLDPIADAARTIPPENRNPYPFWVWAGPGGHLYSFYPVATSVLIAPLYLPADLFLRARGRETQRTLRVAAFMEKLCASLVAAVSVGLVFVLLGRCLQPTMALLLTLAFAFGTETWTIASQALWQHGMAELVLTTALLVATARRFPDGITIATLGVCAGLLAAIRPPDAILSVALLSWTSWRVGRRSFVAWGIALALTLPPVLFNRYVFGGVAGGYHTVGIDRWSHPWYGHPLVEGIAGLLASPAKGLLVFCPFFLWLAARLTQDRATPSERSLSLTLGIAISLSIVVYACADWRAGNCYGPRFLTDILPALVWMLALRLPDPMPPSRHSLFVCAVILAVAIQAIGAFGYPRGGSDAAYYPPGQDRLRIPASVWKPGNAAFLIEARALFRR